MEWVKVPASPRGSDPPHGRFTMSSSADVAGEASIRVDGQLAVAHGAFRSFLHIPERGTRTRLDTKVSLRPS